jgi:hypothetical protein
MRKILHHEKENNNALSGKVSKLAPIRGEATPPPLTSNDTSISESRSRNRPSHLHIPGEKACQF